MREERGERKFLMQPQTQEVGVEGQDIERLHEEICIFSPVIRHEVQETFKSPVKMLLLTKALNHPVRLQVLNVLLKKDSCICELEYYLGVNRSVVTRAVKTLEGAGLVKVVPYKKYRLVILNRDEWLVNFLERLFGMDSELVVASED